MVEKLSKFMELERPLKDNLDLVLWVSNWKVLTFNETELYYFGEVNQAVVDVILQYVPDYQFHEVVRITSRGETVVSDVESSLSYLLETDPVDTVVIGEDVFVRLPNV